MSNNDVGRQRQPLQHSQQLEVERSSQQMKKPRLTVSFSGAGHLIAYHLGVSKSLLNHQDFCNRIKSVSGSSSGAIAAAIVTQIPHRLDEYSDRFLKERGKAFEHFRALMEEEKDRSRVKDGPNLLVCATRSSDGSPQLFPFTAPYPDQERLFDVIRASCQIPASFHPLDLFAKNPMTYEGEGIEIDGTLYVDGGVSGVFPPARLHDQEQSHRILVTPIAVTLTETTKEYLSTLICPHKGAPSMWSRFFTTRDGIAIEPSVSNIQSLVPASGMTSSEALEDWYLRGMDDGERQLDVLMDTEFDAHES
ncbi:expressed unknown protein [Seminavis robusta]|uniref:PNPLA domain-containing protein n=1 Tax=Seminavis robusta TaxID=568900 RepID=A0A9N8H7I2_9STRA|nr:expressed unknown protein [Seminavis robusta]|eukprot:Sro180_g078730.1 n/a (307) ;mRNA; r:47264-48184